MAVYQDYLTNGKFSYIKAASIHWFTSALIILFIIGMISEPKVGVLTIIMNLYFVYLIFIKWPKSSKIKELLQNSKLNMN